MSCVTALPIPHVVSRKISIWEGNEIFLLGELFLTVILETHTLLSVCMLRGHNAKNSNNGQDGV